MINIDCTDPLMAQRHRLISAQSADPLIVQRYQPIAQISKSRIIYTLGRVLDKLVFDKSEWPLLASFENGSGTQRPDTLHHNHFIRAY